MRNGIKVRALVGILLAVVLISGTACNRLSQAEIARVSPPVPTDSIVITSASFNPPHAVVTAGDAVTWLNQDTVSYAIADDNGSFAFTVPARGEFKITFPDAGTYNYHCLSNPQIQGTIVVVPGALCESLTKGASIGLRGTD